MRPFVKNLVVISVNITIYVFAISAVNVSRECIHHVSLSTRSSVGTSNELWQLRQTAGAAIGTDRDRRALIVSSQSDFIVSEISRVNRAKCRRSIRRRLKVRGRLIHFWRQRWMPAEIRDKYLPASVILGLWMCSSALIILFSPNTLYLRGYALPRLAYLSVCMSVGRKNVSKRLK